MTPDAAAVILNVAPDASRQEIEQAYKLRARLSHPDRFSGAPASDIAAATAEFVRIASARDALIDRVRLREEAAARPKPAPSTGPSPARQPATPSGRKAPMSFQEFLRARDSAAWGPNPRTGR